MEFEGTLHQLRTFVVVAEAGSVRTAADRLVVSQPAVSGALRALQDAVGIPLVEPNGRGIRLTAGGDRFADYAQRVLGLLDEAQAAAMSGQDPERGLVRVVAVTTAGEHLVPRALAGFRRDYPHVSVRLGVGTRDQVWAWMAQRQADVALGGRPPLGSGLRVQATAENRLVLVAAPTSGHGSETTLEALSSATWLFREEGSGTRATLEALLEQAEMHPPTLTLGSNGAVIEGAVAGLGVALVSSIAVARELAAGELVAIPARPLPLRRPWHAVTQADPVSTASLFVERLVAGAGTPYFAPADETA